MGGHRAAPRSLRLWRRPLRETSFSGSRRFPPRQKVSRHGLGKDRPRRRRTPHRSGSHPFDPLRLLGLRLRTRRLHRFQIFKGRSNQARARRANWAVHSGKYDGAVLRPVDQHLRGRRERRHGVLRGEIVRNRTQRGRRPRGEGLPPHSGRRPRPLHAGGRENLKKTRHRLRPLQGDSRDRRNRGRLPRRRSHLPGRHQARRRPRRLHLLRRLKDRLRV
mmetsp:Transcript_24878/g.80475  ORF Transcript_24878/g.80475 Transcript_24878/m.80475 type:complete len:219 (-) Transcript_24878:3074-3730(-)